MIKRKYRVLKPHERMKLGDWYTNTWNNNCDSMNEEGFPLIGTQILDPEDFALTIHKSCAAYMSTGLLILRYVGPA